VGRAAVGILQRTVNAPALALVATCASGLEDLLDQELAALAAANAVGARGQADGGGAADIGGESDAADARPARGAGGAGGANGAPPVADGVAAATATPAAAPPPRERQRGAVRFTGGWRDCWRANWRLRTANRVLVELGSWPAADGGELAAGARALAAGRMAMTAGVQATAGGELLHPDRSFAIQATTVASRIRDSRWAALSAKDGLVDGQRERWGRRADVDRRAPDLQLRLRLHEDQATLLLDTSGEPLDRRGYRALSIGAPLRETLAAACVLAAGWNGQGAVVDPMCGSGTLLVEAGWLALGIAPGQLRPAGSGWAFERLPGFDPAAFAAIRAELLPAPGRGLRLLGNDRSLEALRAARANLERAGLGARVQLVRGEAAECRPPAGRADPAERADRADRRMAPGLVLVNPPYGERAAAEAGQWRALGDLLKNHFRGWTAVVLAGGEGLGKHIGLRPRRRLPVKNGPLDARILVFDLF
jgi:23S rRNA G2445 N2-methylase RlmL